MENQIMQLEERLERMERRLNKYAMLLNKKRAKLRRLKKEQSVVGITKPAKIRMVSEELDGITKITQDQQMMMVSDKEGMMSQQQQQQQQQTTNNNNNKTKMVRLKPEANYLAAVFCNARPFPRIPDWQLAMHCEYTQELYREYLALSEEMDKVHQDMNEQVFRKGYIEVEVTDDEE